MKRRKRLYLIWLVTAIYFSAKYTINAAPDRFDTILDNIVFPFLYMPPVIFFSMSSYMLLFPKEVLERSWWRLAGAVIFTLIGCAIVQVFYIGIDVFSAQYFQSLHEGTLVSQESDLRVEYSLFLLVNMIAYIILLDRKVQPWLARNSKS